MKYNGRQTLIIEQRGREEWANKKKSKLFMTTNAIKENWGTVLKKIQKSTENSKVSFFCYWTLSTQTKCLQLQTKQKIL